MRVDPTKGLDLRSIVSHRWIINSCSAYSGQGIHEGLGWVIAEVAGRLYWSGTPQEVAVNTPGGAGNVRDEGEKQASGEVDRHAVSTT